MNQNTEEPMKIFLAAFTLSLISLITAFLADYRKAERERKIINRSYDGMGDIHD